MALFSLLTQLPWSTNLIQNGIDIGNEALNELQNLLPLKADGLKAIQDTIDEYNSEMNPASKSAMRNVTPLLLLFRALDIKKSISAVSVDDHQRALYPRIQFQNDSKYVCHPTYALILSVC